MKVHAFVRATAVAGLPVALILTGASPAHAAPAPQKIVDAFFARIDSKKPDPGSSDWLVFSSYLDGSQGSGLKTVAKQRRNKIVGQGALGGRPTITVESSLAIHYSSGSDGKAVDTYTLLLDNSNRVERVIVPQPPALAPEEAEARAAAKQVLANKGLPPGPRYKMTAERQIIEQPSSTSQPDSVAAATYDGNAAAAYARRWGTSSNPAFVDYQSDGNDNTSDCTNFISQAVQAGGWRQIDDLAGTPSGWFSYRLGSQWFHRNAWTLDPAGRSWTWAGVPNFVAFGESGAVDAPRFQHSAPSRPPAVGDLIAFIDGSGTPEHLMMITDMGSGGDIFWDTIRVTGHSAHVVDASFHDIQMRYANDPATQDFSFLRLAPR